jgi:vitamin K-dependent gamma-carboxylase
MKTSGFIAYLDTPISNLPLVLFRIFWGFLMMVEAWGALGTGWVKKLLVDEPYPFPFIDFEWLLYLAGPWMYFHYFLMGLAGIGIMLGWRYRLSAAVWLLLWACVYFMQKIHYNNHYYLMLLLSAWMLVLPAQAAYSIDVRAKRTPQQHFIPRWIVLFFVLQITIVYTYAAAAKLYPGWLEGDYVRIMLASGVRSAIDSHYPAFIIPILEWPPLVYVLVYGGLFFDALIAPALMFRQTRLLAFVLSCVFHLFNSLVLQIGIFPYLAIALCVFFFPKEHLINLIPEKWRSTNPIVPPTFHTKPWLLMAIGIYFLWQLYLPLRHWTIPGDVLITEEGHRLSWRMKLRSKAGQGSFRVLDAETNERIEINPFDYLSPASYRLMLVRPDFIWQYAQYLEKDFQQKGIPDIKVYANISVELNGSKNKIQLTDPSVDLTEVEWNRFGHEAWLK